MALTTWYRALLARASTPAVVCCIGDSTTEGQAGINQPGPDGWQPYLRDELRRRWPGGGSGEGYNPPGPYGVLPDWSFDNSDYDPSRGMSQRGVTVAPGGGLYRTAVTGTQLRVRYSTLPTGGTLQLIVDGTVVATQSTSATASDHHFLTAAIPPVGSHDLGIYNSSPVGAGSIYVSNVGVLNGEESAGVQWWGHGHSGFMVSDFLAAEGGNGPQEITDIQPHLVTIELGANEWFTSVPAATFQSNLGTLVDRIRARTSTDPSVLLIINWAKDDTGWVQYANAIKAVAASRFCDWIDLRDALPARDPEQPMYENYGTGGGYHLTDSGDKVVADALLELVAPRHIWAEMTGGVQHPLTLAGAVIDGVVSAASVASVVGADDLTEAAVAHEWGTPTFSDDFPGTTLGASWTAPDTAGHGGNGLRRATQVTVADSILTLTGLANGTTGYVARFSDARTYGRWEARMRVPAGADQYHPVMLLWPESNDWPADGEIDWFEAHTCNSPFAEFNNHFDAGGSTDAWTRGQRVVDISRWHNYAVEWTATAVRGYIDGTLFFEDTGSARIPPGPMYPAIQLDWFPGGTTVQSTMLVDWWREYDL